MKENSEIAFLKKKFPDLERTNNLKEKFKQQEKLQTSPIQNYLDRINKILETKRPDDKTGADLMIQKIKSEFTLDIEDKDLVLKLANDLYNSEKKQAEDKGMKRDIEQLNDEQALERYKGSIEEKYQIQQKH